MRKKKTAIIIAIITVIAIIAFVIGKNYNNTLWETVLLGAISSLVASTVFYLFDEIVFGDKNSIEDIRESISSIDDFSHSIFDQYRYELKRIDFSDITDKKNDIWMAFLKASATKLDITAHTLSPWFRSTYAPMFKETINRIIKAGGKVRILILDPEGENLKQIKTDNLEEYKEKIKGSLDELGKIKKELSDADKDRLIVKINGKLVIPYSYLANESEIAISPYLSSSSGRSSFVAVFSEKSSLANSYINDFEDTFNSATSKIPSDPEGR